MRNMLLFFICLSFLHAPVIWAEKMAITDMGEEVILYDDGSWIYVADQTNSNETLINLKKFKKSPKATFLLKSKRLNVGFWVDTDKWRFEKNNRNSDAEYELKLKDGDLYGMVITEKVEIPLETFKTVAIANAKKAAPNARIVKEEYRNVNGHKVLLLQIHGTMQGIKFSYYGYYYSNKHGSVQFITFTSQAMHESYLSQAEKLLNGFVELPKNKK